MSDIGIIFPIWLVAGLALVLALPVTTAIMAGLGVAAYRIRRRDRTRRLTGLKWSAIAIAPFWIGGIVIGCWMLASTIFGKIGTAQRYFTLDKAAAIDGIALPAGTRVELDENRVLRVAELPDGAAVTLRGRAGRARSNSPNRRTRPTRRTGRSPTGRSRRRRRSTPFRAGRAAK